MRGFSADFKGRIKPRQCCQEGLRLPAALARTNAGSAAPPGSRALGRRRGTWLPPADERGSRPAWALAGLASRCWHHVSARAARAAQGEQGQRQAPCRQLVGPALLQREGRAGPEPQACPRGGSGEGDAACSAVTGAATSRADGQRDGAAREPHRAPEELSAWGQMQGRFLRERVMGTGCT